MLPSIFTFDATSLVLVVETADLSDIGSYYLNFTGILPDGNAESVVFLIEIVEELVPPIMN